MRSFDVESSNVTSVLVFQSCVIKGLRMCEHRCVFLSAGSITN
jgi:hypothetical protein